MTSYILLAVFVGIPLVLVAFLRTNGAMLFFSVAVSVLLQQFLDADAAQVVNGLLPKIGIDYMSLIVFLLPLVFVAVLYSGSVKKSLIVLHLLLAVLAGLSALLVADRFLPSAWVVSYNGSNVAKIIRDYQTIIIATGLLLGIFIMHPGRNRDHHKKHEH